MTKDHIQTTLAGVLDEHIVAVCVKRASDVESYLTDIQQSNDQLINLLKKTDKAENNFEIAKNYQQWKIDKFKEVFKAKDVPFYDLDLTTYRHHLDEFLKLVPEHTTEEQLKERFYSVVGDPRVIKIIKHFKRFFYVFSTLPERFLNLLLKLFGKFPKRIRYWKHSVPLRLLVSYLSENVFTAKLTKLCSELAGKSVEILKEALGNEQKINELLIKSTLYGSDAKLDLNDLTIDLSSLFKNHKKNVRRFKSEIKKTIASGIDRMWELSKMTGTIEYPTGYLRYQNRKKRKGLLFKRLSTKDLGWGNTVFGLFEDWKIDQEIYNLNYFSRSKIIGLNSEFQESNREIEKLLSLSKSKISQFNDELCNDLKDKKKEPTQIIRRGLESVKERIASENLTVASEVFINFNLPEKINRFELKIRAFLKEISEKRWLTKLTDYNKPFSASDLDSFSPRELISFEYLPRLNEQCAVIKARIVQHIEKIQQGIHSVEHVVAFNLSSLIESIEKGECDTQSIPDLISEGLERSKNKIDEVVDLNNAFANEIAQELLKVASEFNDSTLTLTINENAFNLRIIVMKAKAVKKSEEFGLRLLNLVKVIKETSIKKGKKIIATGQNLLLPWKQKIGLDGSDVAIATELSDFLQEVHQKIDNLPIIYQRLYKIMPLTEMSLFTGRQNELNALVHAYKSWENGKYSPTVIIGEKWSGQTTLINYFVDKYLENKEVIRLNLNLTTFDETDFFSAWQNILGLKEVSSIEQVIEGIKNKFNRQVLVLEKLQDYYLRTIHGFETMKALIKLISSTNKDVFWLCSANIYAWSYLNKTIELSGFFGYVISMNPFSDEELRELIMKKNNISGYKINFRPSSKNLVNKKFRRLTADEKQSFLRDQFFKELNEFARGNISLALSYWLLSTTNITEESIEITNFSPPDFSFVGKLDAEKVFIIYLVIMHDGLTLEQLCKVYQKSIEALNLPTTLLLDDGIIVKKDATLEVNPLIYRHSINMLKSKNLIYQ